MASTAREALLAEILGDVGNLHDSIGRLPEAFQTAIAPTLKDILKASCEARASLQEHREHQVEALRGTSRAEQEAIRDAAAQALRGLASSLQGALRTHAEQQARSTVGRTWKWVLTAVLCALGGTLAGLGGGYLLFGQEQAEMARFGRAVSRVWDQLDAKSRQVIQNAQLRIK